MPYLSLFYVDIELLYVDSIKTIIFQCKINGNKCLFSLEMKYSIPKLTNCHVSAALFSRYSNTLTSLCVWYTNKTKHMQKVLFTVSVS